MQAVAVPRPRTEVWFRNPRLYYRQLVAEGVRRVVWDEPLAKRYKINPPAFMGTFFGMAQQWRTLQIGSRRAQMWTDLSPRNPAAVYPVWSAHTDGWSALEELAKKPLSERKHPKYMQPEHRPVEGQDHVIVVTDLPNLKHNANKQFMYDLSDFQEDHMDCTLFIHGVYSYQCMFGQEFQMVDAECREFAANQGIYLPGGGLLHHKGLQELYSVPFWAKILDMTAHEIVTSAEKRCIYNIRSAMWAGTYFKRAVKFGLKPGKIGSFLDKKTHAKILESKSVFSKRLVGRTGDRVVCDDCSLWLACKYYREGAVCVVPNTETKRIAELFKTRDAGQVTTALTQVLALQLERAETPLKDEAASGELDAELSKLMATIFKDGVELLKIVDPSYRTGKAGTVQISVAGGASQEITANDAQKTLAQQAIRALVEAGTPQNEITSQMVVDWVSKTFGPEKAKELTAG